MYRRCRPRPVPIGIGLGWNDEVALDAPACQPAHNLGGQESPVEDRQRFIRDIFDELLCVQHFVGRIRAERGTVHQVRWQRGQRDATHLGIAGDRTADVPLCAEMIAVLNRIVGTQGRAVHGKHLQPFEQIGSLSCATQCLAERSNSHCKGSDPTRWRACAAALLLTNGVCASGIAKPRSSSTSPIDLCRYSANATISHTTCSAGRRRCRILTESVLCTACSTHSTASALPAVPSRVLQGGWQENAGYRRTWRRRLTAISSVYNDKIKMPFSLN